MKIIKSLFIMLLGLAIGAGGLYYYQNFYAAPSQVAVVTDGSDSDESTVIDLSVLEESMKKSSELSTAKYLYTSSSAVSDINDLGFIGHPEIKVPLTDATYIFEFDGAIKAGFDLSKASIKLKDNSTVVVTLPAPKILSHETGEIRTILEKQNFFNHLELGEETAWISEQKKAMEKRASDLGLFDEARTNAKATFESLFATAIPEDATLQVEIKRR